MVKRNFFKILKGRSLREKCPNTEFFFGPYFPAFGLNTEIYSVNLRLQSEYRKMQTRKNSVFGHFPRSGCFLMGVHTYTIFGLVFKYLTLSWRTSLSYRTQSIDLLWKSMDWFLHDRDVHHERGKGSFYAMYFPYFCQFKSKVMTI